MSVVNTQIKTERTEIWKNKISEADLKIRPFFYSAAIYLFDWT